MSDLQIPGVEKDTLPQGQIVELILTWWDANQLELPWRANRDPYAIWISEVMLQQTHIATVLPNYERWMARFPTVNELAQASLDTVLKLWEGLGYYSRARNLHKAAQIVIEKYDGKLPEQVSELMTLPGIGRYTAGAVASIAFNQQVPVLDGNIIRVLARLIDLPDDINKSSTKNFLWSIAKKLVPEQRPGDYNQALMELGQQLCSVSAPQCSACPLTDLCLANKRETQNQRPVRSPRKKIPHYDVVAAIIWQDKERLPTSKFLIAQRPLNGLLGGLWEFPGGKQEPGETLIEALHREICEEIALDIVIGEQLTLVKHAYTHFRISLHAFHAYYQGGQPQHNGVKDHVWVTMGELGKFAFAGADRKIIAALKAELLA